LGDGTVRRYCTSVTEVTGLEEGHVAMTELWGLDDTGHLVPQHVPSAERRRRLARSGWEWTVDGWADQLPDREAR
jgi:hypothetical protein